MSGKKIRFLPPRGASERERDFAINELIKATNEPIPDPEPPEPVTAADVSIDAIAGISAGNVQGALEELGIVSSQDARRNRVINGAMQVSQQNGNASGTSYGFFAADQWSAHFVTSAGVITTQRVQSLTPGGATDRVRMTITTPDTSLAAAEYLFLTSIIEGNNVADFMYGTASARQAILRFLFKGPSGTYAVSIRNPAANRSYVATFSPAAANTDEIIEIVIPGDTSGTWPTGNGAGLIISIVLACGTTFQGTTGWQAGNIVATSGVSNGMGTASAVFEFGEFGLYLDPDASGIAPEWELPSLADELFACKRYFQFLPNWSGIWVTTTSASISGGLPVEMRVSPTATLISGTNAVLDPQVAFRNASAITAAVVGPAGGYVYLTTATGVAGKGCWWTNNGVITLSARL